MKINVMCRLFGLHNDYVAIFMAAMVVGAPFSSLLSTFSLLINRWWGKTIVIVVTSSFLRPHLDYCDIISKYFTPFCLISEIIPPR